MSLLTNEEKGLRCHAEVTKKVKEGKRPEAAGVAALALPAPPNPFIPEK